MFSFMVLGKTRHSVAPFMEPVSTSVVILENFALLYVREVDESLRPLDLTMELLLSGESIRVIGFLIPAAPSK